MPFAAHSMSQPSSSVVAMRPPGRPEASSTWISTGMWRRDASRRTAWAAASPAMPAPTTRTLIGGAGARTSADPRGLGGERGLDDVREGVEERGEVVQRLGAAEGADAELLRRVSVEQVDFIERLDVVRDEADGDDEDVAHALMGEPVDHLIRRRSDPGHGPDAALVREHVRQVLRQEA